MKLPDFAVSTAEDLADPGGKRPRRRPLALLLVGEVPVPVRRELLQGARQLDFAANIYLALEKLAQTTYDAVVVDRLVEGGGLQLVKCVKAMIELPWANPEHLLEARHLHARTPFFVADVTTLEYAVIIAPPEHSYFEDGEKRPLAKAVLCFDPSKLVWARGNSGAN